MGYLNLQQSPPDFSELIISIWFRVPEDLLNDALNDWVTNINAPSRYLIGVVPIITWGVASTLTVYHFDGSTSEGRVGPSFIGVQMDDVWNEPHLVIRFQSDNIGSVYSDPTQVQLVSTVGNAYTIGYQDGMILVSGDERSNPKPIRIASDTWHHLLVSFSAAGETGQLWVALDNHNYNGDYFWPACRTTDGPNDITSNFKFAAPDLVSGGFTFIITPFGIPVPSTYADRNAIVELAEFQLFSGVTLDTSIAANRHFFIEDSKPVDPAGRAMAGGIKKFYKDPDILLHGVNNWKQGRNTGTHDVQFTHHGHIVKFKPEPELGA